MAKFKELEPKIETPEPEIVIPDTENKIDLVTEIAKPEPEQKVFKLNTNLNHSIYYNGVSYLPGAVIENIKESDLKELLKFGKLV